MKSITFNSQNSFKAKHLLTASVLALTGLMASATANAGLVTGSAVFTIDNDAVTSSIPTPNFSFIVTTHSP